uniref:Uncharacterized protein n=1 Tax=Oryza sativa subsp. japonica TaxID=39947 RepID=Q67W31_ORYSJ|nr:hypothetical protein [Oryza sativa Japonica Group]
MEGTRRHLEKDLEPWRIIEDVQVKVEAQTKSISGISLLGEVNRVSARLITRGDVVLRLWGSRACAFKKPDRFVS